MSVFQGLFKMYLRQPTAFMNDFRNEFCLMFMTAFIVGMSIFYTLLVNYDYILEFFADYVERILPEYLKTHNNDKIHELAMRYEFIHCHVNEI